MRKNHTESHFRYEKTENNHIFRGKPFSPSGKNGNLFVDTADVVFSKMETTTRKNRTVGDKMTPTEQVSNPYKFNSFQNGKNETKNIVLILC